MATPGFPLPTQAYRSGENREARQQGEYFQKRREALLAVLGGEQALSEALQKAGSAEWVSHFNGPHRKHGELKAFDYSLESGRHGDQHRLWKEWDDEFGFNNNYVLPFMKLGWSEPVAPAFWIMVTHPEDHYRIATTQVQKSPVYAGGSYGKSFLAHIDEGEWKRRRFNSIHAVAPMHIRGYFHKMERHCHKLVERIASGKEGTMMYGGAGPEPAFNLHEMVADTAFKIACDCLYGLDDEFVEERSRKIRWALQKTDAAVAPAVALQQEWASELAKVPEEKRGPLLEALLEQREEYPERAKEFSDGEKAYHDDVQILSIAMHDTTGKIFSIAMHDTTGNDTPHTLMHHALMHHTSMHPTLTHPTLMHPTLMHPTLTPPTLMPPTLMHPALMHPTPQPPRCHYASWS
jgi:hypothetical protein